MNSLFNGSRLAVWACGAVLLVACDSVKDVRTEPYTDIPATKGVLAGRLVGVGTARPVELRYNGQPACLAPDPANAALKIPVDCKFYGTAGQNEANFTFGSLDTGTPYTITVDANPYGKTCTVANASGTVGASAPPVVTCTDDTVAVPRYDVTVNTSGFSGLANLWVRLQTEEGDWLQNATGQPNVVFEDVIFNSGSNLPLFSYKLTAYTESNVGGVVTTNYCTFAPSAGFNLGGENRNPVLTVDAFADDSVVVPTGPASVTVNACTFTPSVAAQYHGSPTQTMPASPGNLQLGLKNHFTGAIEQNLEITTFSATAVPFGASLMANAQSIYELVITRQPTGMQCIVFGTTTTNADTNQATAGVGVNITAPTASAVLLVDPSNTDWWAYLNRQVRCRAVPGASAQLTGTYQMDARTGNQNTTPPRPYGRPREFITFFADGTFLFGINNNTASSAANSPNSTWPALTSVRNNWAASSGVQHGFYTYNSAAGTIAFNVFTNTITNASGRGLAGMPGYTGFPAANAPNVTATGVVKTAPPDSTLAMTFTSGPTTRLWTMTEPASIAGEITGTWVTADHKRMFAYDASYTYAFHIGVNGMGNLQDTCMIVIDGSTQSGGVITRHAGSATNSEFVYTCTPGIINPGAAFVFARTLDLPHYALKNSVPSGLGIGPTTPRIAPGFNGRFPGSASQLDNRPGSPVLFQVTAGSPDTLLVQETLNGEPVNAPITFYRERAN